MAAGCKWAVLLTAIVCGFLSTSQGEILSPRCTSSLRRAVTVSTSLTLQCNVQSADVTITWVSKLTGVGSSDTEIGRCPPLPANCTSSGTSVVSRPEPLRSDLRFTSPAQREHSVTVTCQASGVSVISYIIDLYQGIVSSSGCKASFVKGPGDDWRVDGQCAMYSVFSADRCYSCDWFEKKVGVQPTSLTQYQRLSVVNNSDGTVNLTCGFNKPIPTVGGSYQYLAKILPAAVEIVVPDGSNVLSVTLPSKPTHDCPDYVPEGGTLACTCAACKTGSPEMKPKWEATGQSTLQLADVQRDQNGNSFTCRMQLGEPLQYTVRVAYGPDTAHIVVIGSDASLTLICLPVHVNPTPSFLWTVRGTNEVLETSQVLEDIPFSVFEEGKVIECTVSNYENKGLGATAFIDIEGARLHSNVTLARSSAALSSGGSVGAGVAIGLGVAVALVLVLAIVVVIVLRRRQWLLPCADEDESRKSQRQGGADSTNGRKQGLQLTLAGIANRRPSASDESLGEEGDRAADAGNYEGLKRKGDSPDHYMSLGGPNAKNLTSRSPYIDDAGPVYENRASVMQTPKEFPVYANSYTDGKGFRL